MSIWTYIHSCSRETIHNEETVFAHQMLHLKSTAQVLMKFGVGNLQQ
jgi:hypothetical protein